GRQFGGVGLMVAEPALKLRAMAFDTDEVHGPDELHPRIVGVIDSYRKKCTRELIPPACHIAIEQAPSSHVGLGSGTQLSLAVSRALAELAGEPEVPAVELARRVGRGLRSAIGIHGFEHGGFLV